jgi:pimeloyl-ACP methyl ester carboxylesterase
LELLVEQAVAVIRAASGNPVDVLGYSLGAVVAAALAAEHPELVSRLVLVGGWASGDDTRHQLVFDTWSRLEASDPDLSLRFALTMAFSADFLGALGRDQVAQILGRKSTESTRWRIELGRDVDIRERLSRVLAPTLVVGLARDHFIAPARCHDLAGRIADSRYTELPCGHAVVFERPDALVSVVRDFLFSTQDGDPTAPGPGLARRTSHQETPA